MKRITKISGSLGKGYHEKLSDMGYEHKADGLYESGLLRVELNNNWMKISKTCLNDNMDPLQGQTGSPGLWKFNISSDLNNSEVKEQVFEIPISLLSISGQEEQVFDGSGGDKKNLFEDVLKWAETTFRGNFPETWMAPPIKEIEEYLPSSELTVRNGEILRQGTLVCNENCLALIYPILPGIPENLPLIRKKWLDKLCIEAQNRWRLVRIGFSEKEGMDSVLAEIDLTGVPYELMEMFIKISNSALRWVLMWLVRSAVFLADTSNECEALKELQGIEELCRNN